MKLVGIIPGLFLVACGGASNAPASSVTTSNAASVSGEEASKAAPAPAAPALAETAKPAEPASTPAAAPAAEAEPLPKIEFTPANELRTNSKAKFESALKSSKGQTSANGVSNVLTRLLGKPTWIEEDSKRVWVANDPTQCVRLVLEQDGTTNLESLRSTESKVVSRTHRQNLCTGKFEQDE